MQVGYTLVFLIVVHFEHNPYNLTISISKKVTQMTIVALINRLGELHWKEGMCSFSFTLVSLMLFLQRIPKYISSNMTLCYTI